MSKKVLLIGPLSPPITGNSLANDVVLKTFKNSNEIQIEAINTQMESFQVNTGVLSSRKVFFYLKKYLNLYRVLSNDVIYITLGQTYFGVIKYAPFIYLAKILQKEVIIHIHGNYLKTQYKLLTGCKKYIFVRIIKKADKVIVLSESLIENLVHFLPLKNVYIVPNFVEETLRPINIKIKGNEPLKVIYLSNLMSEKGVLDLMNSLMILKKNKIEFEARFAGNIEKKIEHILMPFFASKEITYLGIVSGEQKKEMLEWSNVFVLPTYYKMEGIPISILEAMSTGNIILTTKHAGIQDVISEKNGFFVKPKSPKDISKKLIHIKSNFDKLNDMRLHNLAESKKYTEKLFIDNLLNIFTI